MGARVSEKNNGRSYSETHELKKGFRYFKHAHPYLLSHHPHCKYYAKDFLKIGKWRFCWGCIVTYPTFIAVLIGLLLLGIHNDFTWWQFIIAGVIFGSFELISLWRKGTGLRHRTIKFFLGIGLALTTIGVFTIPIHLAFRIVIYFYLYMMAGLFGSLRIIAMEKKCRKCRWKGNWYRCPGFEELNSSLEKEGLLKRK
jgi:hypothetical protein